MSVTWSAAGPAESAGGRERHEVLGAERAERPARRRHGRPESDGRGAVGAGEGAERRRRGRRRHAQVLHVVAAAAAAAGGGGRVALARAAAAEEAAEGPARTARVAGERRGYRGRERERLQQGKKSGSAL